MKFSRYICTLHSKLFHVLFGYPVITSGAEGIRTPDPLLARQVLSQLSYTPVLRVMGLSGLEPPTSRLSGVRSNRLSYKPLYKTLSGIILFSSGSHLPSHTVSSAVLSAAWVLTIVFGMGTGVPPKRIATRYAIITSMITQQ